jgi:hypothetical protein
MNENQAEFKGWAKVEVMGHQSHVGYVTTEAYGQAVLFRIDSPALEECDEELRISEYVGEQYCRPGSIIRRAAVPALSVLVGSGSIYRIIPCDEATAITSIRSGTRRPLSVVKLVESARIQAPNVDDEMDDDEEQEQYADEKANASF